MAERVLLPGDPGRALRLAQQLIEGPKMLNHNRGLWGYSGPAADGEPLTVQSTGVGGPSAAIVVEELIELGARRIVRVGTCGALDPELRLGGLVVVERALALDGASRALGAEGTLDPDPTLLRALRGAAGRDAATGAVATVDLFYDPDPARVPDAAMAVEMGTAAVFAVARRHGVAAAALLAVTDLLDGERRRIGDEALLESERRLGHVAAQALS